VRMAGAIFFNHDHTLYMDQVRDFLQRDSETE